ncbi:MAG: nucleotidyltransferase, partial [Bacillota bacterium]
RHAIISGLLSSGTGVVDYGRLTLPALRSAVRFYRLDGGVYVSSYTTAGSKVITEFLDKTGSSIDRSIERKIESSFMRDDFNRCEGDCIKGVNEIKEFMEFYINSILLDVMPGSMKYRIALNTCTDYVSGIITDLLSRLGCDVAVFNADGDENGSKGMKWFSSIVKNGKFDLGVSIGDTCEKMILVDDRGRLVTEDMFIALVALILFRKMQGCTVIVPLTASLAVEKLADEYHGKVLRTKSSARDMMVNLLGRETKEELLEQFTMNFDAAASLVKILDYMTLNRLRLSDLVNMIPEIHMRRREVECDWSSKGRVIRKLIQEHTGCRTEMLEGVKVFNDKGWVLILPDAEKPVCSVIGEGLSAEFAEELTDIYARKVREISRN